MSAAMPSTRLSLNQMTLGGSTLPEAVDACVHAGIESIGLWREKVAETGLAEAKKHVQAAGLTVSSLCRGGFFSAGSERDRRRRFTDNRRAIDEAVELGAPVLVLVCGGLADRSLAESRSAVEDGVAMLIPHAEQAGVQLGVEPLHPMFCADRSVISTLQHANDLVERIQSEYVGVVVDAYHLWWEPGIEREIARAGSSIVGFHVADWIVPIPDVLMGRGLIGDGCIDLRSLRRAVDAAGYAGAIEVEIFNETSWRLDPQEAAHDVRRRFEEFVLDGETVAAGPRWRRVESHPRLPGTLA
jgi:sugar phosphate isomerase/epimerase